ncbi:MAG: hypothetical protein IE909_04530 [Campylobacterales bacterium]|nr:hypothetical protein [Campylobacterales bacterium]
MYEIKIINPCSCVKKRKAWSKELIFETLENAKDQAEQMVIQGNEKFCKRHCFSLSQNGNSFEITTSSKSK